MGAVGEPSPGQVLSLDRRGAAGAADRADELEPLRERRLQGAGNPPGVMSRLPGRRLFRFPWRTAAQVAADVDTELDFHLGLVARELMDDGWPAEAAAIEARRRFGDLEATRRICRNLDVRKETQ